MDYIRSPTDDILSCYRSFIFLCIPIPLCDIAFSSDSRATPNFFIYCFQGARQLFKVVVYTTIILASHAVGPLNKIAETRQVEDEEMADLINK